MPDQTKADPRISAGEREILRDIALKVAELAARPIEQEKRDLWYKHNALEPTRPVVFCDPKNGWWEIFTPDTLKCQSDLARMWEFLLRREVFYGERMCDDRVIQPFFDISHVQQDSGWGLANTITSGGKGGSYVWDAPIKSMDDVDKLHFPEVTVDYEATQRNVDLANWVLGDILTVRQRSGWWWTLGLTSTLIFLRGLEQMMLDMTDNPQMLHRIMGILRDGHLAKIDFFEKNGLFCLNSDGSYVGSGGFGWSRELPQPDFAGTVRTRDMWGFAESQETVGVSPAMFDEFVFQYQLPLLERFGLNCYGCCEPLDKRWHVVSRIPRLRRVSVSAWANVADMAENLGGDYVFSYKPNPADLAAPTFDEARIRANMREFMQTTKNCRVEVIMKDNHTIGRDPERVVRWTKIVREEADRL